MPKETFNNLPEEKRCLIEAAALDEFAEHGFDSSSINRIVSAAGIAKGSFYQYFDDKGDLYRHLIFRISEQKLAYVTPTVQNPTNHNFFTLLEEIYRSGLAFAKDKPKEGKIGLEMYKNQSNPVFKEIYDESIEQANMFFGSLLDQAIARGEIKREIDKAFICHTLIHLQVACFDYYFENIRVDEKASILLEDDLMPTVHLMIDFIKSGIQPQ